MSEDRHAVEFEVVEQGEKVRYHAVAGNRAAGVAGLPRPPVVREDQ